jgi:hypothetical protein
MDQWDPRVSVTPAVKEIINLKVYNNFQQLLLLAKIDQTHGEGDTKPPKSW